MSGSSEIACSAAALVFQKVASFGVGDFYFLGKTEAVSPIRRREDWFVAQSAFRKHLRKSQKLSFAETLRLRVSNLAIPEPSTRPAQPHL